MRAVTVWLLLASAVLFVNVRGECGDGIKNPDEGDVTTWFKSLGCKIQKGAEDIGESAKPWADKIGASAKDFGQNVASKYDSIKHKLTDENVASSTPFVPIVNGPTEKVPLAPLSGSETPAGAISSDKTTTYPSISETPKSLDDRFLFQLNECPTGQVKDFRNECRPTI